MAWEASAGRERGSTIDDRAARTAAQLARPLGVEDDALIAQELIDFDKEGSKIMASSPTDPNRPELGGVDPSELQAYFVMSGRYTAGVATRYAPVTVLTASATHQALARGFTIGMRFHPAPVVRLADAKPMQLGHVARADGAWRIYVFADASGKRLRRLAAFLAESPNSPLRRFSPSGADIDSVIDVRAVFQQGPASSPCRAAPPISPASSDSTRRAICSSRSRPASRPIEHCRANGNVVDGPENRRHPSPRTRGMGPTRDLAAPSKPTGVPAGRKHTTHFLGLAVDRSDVRQGPPHHQKND